MHVPRARGAPISALLLSPEEERRLAPPPSWQPPDFSSYRFPDPRQERSFEPLPRPFETLTRPFEPAPPRARPPSPVPAHPVWLWSEADRDPSRSRSGSSSTSSTLIPTPPTPHKARRTCYIYCVVSPLADPGSSNSRALLGMHDDGRGVLQGASIVGPPSSRPLLEVRRLALSLPVSHCDLPHRVR